MNNPFDANPMFEKLKSMAPKRPMSTPKGAASGQAMTPAAAPGTPARPQFPIMKGLVGALGKFGGGIDVGRRDALTVGNPPADKQEWIGRMRERRQKWLDTISK